MHRPREEANVIYYSPIRGKRYLLFPYTRKRLFMRTRPGAYPLSPSQTSYYYYYYSPIRGKR